MGANDGVHTYPFATHGYRCICLEPQTTCIEVLEGVKQRNNWKKVTVLQTLVGEEDEALVDFYASDSTWFSSRLQSNTERFERARVEKRRTTSLDAVASATSSIPTLVEIDVEGWEWSLVQGARRMIEATRPDLLIEVGSDNPHRADLRDRLTGLGYTCVRLRHYDQRPFNAPVDRAVALAETAPTSDLFLTTRVDLVKSLAVL